MTDPGRLEELSKKLDSLLQRQSFFTREINEIREEIQQLKAAENAPVSKREVKPLVQEALTTPVAEKERPAEIKPERRKDIWPQEKPHRPQPPKTDLEKFIGENLINKIGIAITVIGVAIGAKYAIDHQLVSPLTRVVLGYLFGAGLMAFSIQLKKNYKNFSAVLLSGSMAILYFITYTAYALYDLIPQVAAFAMMVTFTGFAVLAAIQYDMQVIAHIGLVGAYAVPFLLSDGSGRVAILFSYTALINTGILAISFQRYWRPLFYSSFGLTWLIYASWYVSSYDPNKHFTLALIFLAIFFVIFYAAFLAYKLFKAITFEISDIALLLGNSFIFYCIGYAILDRDETGSQVLGMFTLVNALMHFVISVTVFRQRKADPNILYLVTGLVLVFVTLAVPVQLDGNWVTILWSSESLLLFWIGRTKKSMVYELLSYPLMVVAFMSMFQDWSEVYGPFSRHANETRFIPIFNVNFLSSVIFVTAFAGINKLNRDGRYTSSVPNTGFIDMAKPVITSMLLLSLFMAFRMEIGAYWDQQYVDSYVRLGPGDTYPVGQFNVDLLQFKSVWLINYSFIFISVLAYLNIERFKNQSLSLAILILTCFSIFIFLTMGLSALGALRSSYMLDLPNGIYEISVLHILARYISFGLVALTLVMLFMLIRSNLQGEIYLKVFDFTAYVSILWMASAEVIHWMELGHSQQSYKLGLSILWGAYSLMVIVIGIWKKKQYLRMGAIILFAITLVKLFFYDLVDLNTIAKTVVLVLLGIFLLIISFLYNKFKHAIAPENTE